MDELDDYNPYDDYDEEEGFQLVEVKPKKRRKRKNPEPTTLAMPLLLAAIAYLGWCGYAQSKTKVWTWTPWKTVVVGRRLQLRQANNAQAEEERRRQAEFDKALEHALKPSVITIDTEVPWRPVYGDTEKERVSFIEP
ncbi:hypothetical protein ES703_10151 [subsurface metagenome]